MKKSIIEIHSKIYRDILISFIALILLMFGVLATFHFNQTIPWSLILIHILIGLFFLFFSNRAFNKASKALEEKMIAPMKTWSSDFTKLKQNKDEIIEVTLIRDAFIEFAEKLVDTEVAIAKTKVAQQVAHDIRSPLSALEMISSNLVGVEEDKRLIIRNSINRIRDIANTLSKDNRPKQIELSNSNFETTLLSSVIEMMVTEKRFEISKRNNIQIQFNQSKESYGLFANTVLSEFKRILSNLMNNSIEAIGDKKGTVEVKLKSNQNQVQIILTDNGCGMSDSELKNVLQNSSNGLGLSHAIDSIKAWGGVLTIASKSDIGTSVIISLKPEPAPKWFVDAVDLKQINNVIVVDDDQTIHQMWDALLNPNKTIKKDLRIHHFNDCDSVKKFYGKHFVDLDEAIFLVDYEIHNQAETGLSLIELLGIEKQSILVTSHYEDESIRRKCIDLGVGMIPKSMAGFVKINT